MSRTFVNGRVHVRRTQCPTCVFKPGNLCHLEPGRVEGMVHDANENHSAITCHHHLYQCAEIEPVCRGYFELHSSMTLRLAEMMDVITWV